MYEKPRVNVKVERGSTFTFTGGFSYIASILIYARKASESLRPYARKNYATVEIHLKDAKVTTIGKNMSEAASFPGSSLPSSRKYPGCGWSGVHV